jgi:hypothetical protein
LGSATLAGSHTVGDGTVITIAGEAVSDAFGAYSSIGLDVNRDGFHDFLVGATGAGSSDQGRAYLFKGGAPLSLPAAAGSATTILTGAASGDSFGIGLQ